jgi:uncharacterized protein involved in exopolysaccharide biosynthesis
MDTSEEQIITGAHRPGFGSARDLLSLVFRRKWVGLFIFSSIFLASAFSLSRQKVVYVAEARILVERGATGVSGANARPVLHWWEEMKSEVEIARCRPVAERAVEDIARARQAIAETHHHDDLILADAPTAEELMGGFSAEPIEETDVIRLAYRSLDPNSAIEGVNAVTGAFLSYRREMKRAKQTSEFFVEEIEAAQAKVERSRADLAAYKTQHRLTDLHQHTDQLIRQRSNFQDDLTEVRAERAAREAELEVLDRSRAEHPEVLVPTSELGADPNLQTYQRRLSDLQGKLNSLLATYTIDSPQVKAVVRDVEACKVSIREVVDDMLVAKHNELDVLRGRENTLKSELRKIESSLEMMPEHERKVALMTLELKSNTDRLTELEIGHQSHRLNEAVDPRLSNLQLLSQAVSAKRIGGGARQRLFVVFSFILALGMALVAVFMVDTLDHTIKFPADVESALGVPVLSSIREVRPVRPGN